MLKTGRKTRIERKECTNAGGYTSTQARLALDANWHQVNSVSGYENGCTGDDWNSQCFSNPVQRAQNFVLEGTSKDKCESAHSVQQIQDGVKVNFLTQHEHDANVGHYIHAMDDDDKYDLFCLKNREFSFEVDVSDMQC